MKTQLLVMTLAISSIAGSVGVAGPGASGVEEIVRKANHMALYQGRDGKGKVTMVISDKQGRTRERQFTMLRKDEGEANQDQKYYVFFQRPADVRKMVFMVHKHAAIGRDDDRWLYMPGLDLVKRIAASDKRTSFVGSDFLYEDISGRNPAEDTHELIETTEACYVIKNVPKDPGTVEFAYYIAHIDKATFMPVKLEYFKAGDRLYRVIESTQVEPVEAKEGEKRVVYPTVIQSRARDLESGSTSKMTFSEVRYNVGLKDSLFTERYLRRPPRDAIR